MLFTSRIASILLCAIGFDTHGEAFAIQMYPFPSRGRVLSVHDALFDDARFVAMR